MIMSTLELDKAPCLNDLELRGQLPKVAFDARLGGSVRFNYPNYADYLAARGITFEETQDKMISVRKSGIRLPRPFRKESGSYFSGRAEVLIGNRTTEEEANKILTHETEHMIEDIKGNISETELNINLSQNLIRAAGRLSMASGAVYYGIDLLSAPSAPEVTSLGGKMIMGGIGSVILSKVIRRLNPMEMRARDAEKTAQSFLEFAPR
jgi:hypothetical protein